MPQTQFNGPATTSFTGNASIDGILWGWQWASPNLTYSFPQSVNEYFGYTRIDDFTPFTPTQQQQIEAFALNNLTAFSNLTFTETTVPGAANIRFAQSGILDSGGGEGPHFPGFGPTLPRSSAEAVPPDYYRFPSYSYGDNWFSNGNYTEPLLGSFQYAAGLLHEMGHAIGLSHGHITQVVSGTNGQLSSPELPANENSQEFSVMTYSQFVGQTLGNGAIGSADYPWTYMLNDVAAIQHMYGANFNANAGNTTYRFDPTTGELTIDGFGFGASYRGSILATMWDGGGIDTYDFSNHSNNQTIDLNPGGWSTFSTSQLANLNNGQGADAIFARGNLANAYLYQGDTRSLIENVVTGSGNDTIVGNQAANNIQGGGGNDSLFGGLGGDILNGGTGVDFARYDNATTAVAVYLANDRPNSGEAAGDTLIGIEGLILSAHNDYGFGDDNPNYIYGQGGSDSIAGGLGADYLDGGEGFDYVRYDDAAYPDDIRVYLQSQYSSLNTGVAAIGDVFVSIEGLQTSVRNDTLFGNSENNVLLGNLGTDNLYGFTGNDTLYGGAGDPNGDGVRDNFVFDQAPIAANADIVGDFERGLDQIALSSDIFGTNESRIQLNPNTSELVYTGVNGNEYNVIATLIGETVFDANDYYFY
ncbi:M10 family metallopeptidase C-terminal domain-containing protein [Hoeflea sp.]|uniref:M10 family metallopeptidase C-terminal domain-containing protein n=1 Tax=Hoeflea sp. TaxID=1940281 RepID=UPI003BB18CB5